MYSVNYHDDNNCVAQYDFSVSVSNISPVNSSFLLSQLFQDLCDGCGYSINNIDSTYEVSNDISLSEYAIKCGYKLPDDFLLVMMKNKNSFVERVDFVLSDLSCVSKSINSFNFFKKSKSSNEDIASSMSKICSSFSRNLCDLRSKCINILRYNIIPEIIKSIFDSTVIDGDCDRKMTYPEMEQLFLYFVTALEKLIVVKILYYLRDFCSKNNDLSSLVSLVTYSNKFISSQGYNGISMTDLDCPAAFTDKFGKYTSFMAVAKIDEIVVDFWGSLNNVLKKIVGYKCSCIYNYSDSAHDDIEKLLSTFKVLIKEKIDKKIAEEEIEDSIRTFLKCIFIWSKADDIEINRALIFDNIIGYMHNFISKKSANSVLGVVSSFKKKLLLSKRHLVTYGKHLSTIADRWGVRLHPEDDCKISSIKRKFSAKYSNAINNKFREIIEMEYRFSDGTVVSMIDWDKISKNLFPIAQETVRFIVDAECEELSRFLCGARIIEDINLFDGCFAGTRKVTSDEIDSILKISADYAYCKNRNISSKLWKNLIKSKSKSKSNKFNVSKDNCFCSSVEPVTDMVPVSSPSVQTELPVIVSIPVELLCKRDKIISMWGLNLHPDDDKLIMFVRKKFSVQIKHHLSRLFYGMLKNRTVLPSGTVVRDSSWLIISNELSEIAAESVDFISKNQNKELNRVLSKARVVDVDKGDSSYCVVRRVTDDEKNNLMSRVSKVVCKRLNASIRLSWLHVVNEYSTDIGYGYREKYKGICGIAREGIWGVKLRYTDNIDILNIRKKFSSRIKFAVHAKFASMIINNHKFEDGTFISSCAWFRISRRLFPIAKDEVKYILEEESRELEGIISKARAVVDSELDRELTDEEKLTILGNVMKLVNKALKNLFRNTWEGVIFSLSGNCVDIKNCVEIYNSQANRIDEVITSSDCSLAVEKFDVCNKSDDIKISICYEDDLAILNVRNKFSRIITKCITDKYSELINRGYIFNERTALNKLFWKKVSKKMLPIIKREVDPIMESERTKIGDLLSKSRVDISLLGSISKDRVVREITLEERNMILESIMKLVDKQVMRNFGRIWNRIIKLPSVRLRHIREEDRSELDSVKLEFIGSLGSVVDEVVSSLSSGVDLSFACLDDLISNISRIVSERGHNLFNEGGFLDRVELLLSCARVVEIKGNDRFITNEEKRFVLKDFMHMIDSDIDCLIKKRIIKLSNVFLSAK
ncbi:hypothetical protein Ark11_0865 [Candidatus Ichthyocystis hellenicum]|uniref:Uncharacterized protein n=1 Tax=Candidatus Ichthyocystis hellenicum TaxID=1561003 RepID=A0A0S4M6B6_9BURK|nr:hypothetical protein [Candidatus Ichthyocystis hellenicum]CUT17688.1 hypothetical protein Ark11_0865 [Candidatus Ichthyocystis hellenicum]